MTAGDGAHARRDVRESRAHEKKRMMAIPPPIVSLIRCAPLVAAMLPAACALPPAPPEVAAPSVMRPAAVVEVLPDGGEEERDLAALASVAPVEWSHAAWLRLPASRGRTRTAYTADEAAGRPVLFVADRTPHTPDLSVDVLVVNAGPQYAGLAARARMERGPVPGWCEGESWVAAFFVEGIGPKPTAPVVLRVDADGERHELLVDPARSTVRATPALDLGAVGLAHGRVPPRVHVRFARTAPPVVPMLLHRQAGRWWGGGGVAARREYTWFQPDVPQDPVTDVRLYFLALPPPC